MKTIWDEVHSRRLKDLKTTLLYIDNGNISYLCKCIASAAYVVETSGWHKKAAVQELIGKVDSINI